MASSHFTQSLYRFLADLKRHNTRDWFLANKARYERDARDPFLAFIADVAAPLQRISREITADPRPVGGSLFRIHRDTRFSKDKSPYKTHVAAHFRHRSARDVHAPGYYVSLEPGEVCVGAGIWRPDPPSLLAIRKAIVEDPAAWRRALRALRDGASLEGDAVKRPPRGFSPEHPLIEDLKRKDFTAIARWKDKDALAPGFLRRYVAFCRASAPLNGFLARALGQRW